MRLNLAFFQDTGGASMYSGKVLLVPVIWVLVYILNLGIDLQTLIDLIRGVHC